MPGTPARMRAIDPTNDAGPELCSLRHCFIKVRIEVIEIDLKKALHD
jgi:hypothetical protein